MAASPSPAAPPPGPTAPPPGGLTSGEAARRLAAGEGNRAAFPTSRPYRAIVRENVFDFVNTTLFALGLALVALGRPTDALVSVAIVLANSCVGVVQEVRAKRALDRIALLTRPTVAVVRDGREQTVDPGAVVRGDLVRVGPGDQVVADGRLLADGPVEVDESLLTGESRPVAKRRGDPLSSGTFGVAGRGFYAAEAVGAASRSSRLAAGARAFRRESTPLQREINLVIRVVLLVAAYLELLTVVDAAIGRAPVVETVAQSVVVLGIVPNGLVLAIAVAYGAAAVRLAGRGILVGQANAIESLSHVDVLGLDKTGTLTTGRLRLRETRPFGITSEELGRLLGTFAASVPAPDRTSAAIARAFPVGKAEIRAQVPFASARRWSALAFAPPSPAGTYVLGAVDAIAPALGPDAERDAVVRSWAERGLRVLLLARGSDLGPGDGPAESPTLPACLEPLGLVALADELRPEAREILAAFAAGGVRLKLISGDDPRTVAALARQVGLDPGRDVVSGADLAGLSPGAWEAAAEGGTVFGRVAPEQKRDLVRALRRRGRHVAMIGDGVNDVLALKESNLGVALGSGSAAARAVADLVLLDDGFGALPRAVREGRRIQSGMRDILKLFLTRVLSIALLLVGTGMVGAFPLDPKQNALLTLLTVGLPSVALAAWARPDPSAGPSALRRVAHFVVPAAVTLALVELGVHLAASLGVAGLPAAPPGDAAAPSAALAVARTAVTSVAILAGLLLVVFVEPPSEAWVGGDVRSGDRRPALLALALGLAFGAILAVPALRAFFSLVPLGAPTDLLLVATAAAWALLVRWLWRARLVERFLGVDWE